MRLIPIKYHNKNYPAPIESRIDEVAGNFDSKVIHVERPYSLHTEYSYGTRELDSGLLNGLDEIKSATIRGVPELWKSEKWAAEFAEFILRITGETAVPEIIEIHPPFKSYCKDFIAFLAVYRVFEKLITQAMPRVKIFIENRCGTLAGKQFLLSNCVECLKFLKVLSDSDLGLKMVIDYPQLFSGERISMDNITVEKILGFNVSVKEYKHLVGGFHIWGKRKGAKTWVSHNGDLKSYFSNDDAKKTTFLSSVRDTFNDGSARYFVPEVNSSEADLHSIINDMLAAGFIFTNDIER